MQGKTRQGKTRLTAAGTTLLALTALIPTACSQDSEAAPTAPTTRRKGPAPASSRLEFVDVAAEAGLTVVNVSGNARRWYIPESNGNGAAWLDHDGDGDMDLFVGNGAGMVYHDDGRRLEVQHTASSRLYRNDGDLKFTDVTEEAGAGRSEWIQSIATGDIDNDGDPDLYLACLGADVLLRNDEGRFVDATAEAGLGCELWGTGAAFGDIDLDGDLDLYVANYVLFDPDLPPLEGRRNVIDGVQVGWGPEEENKQGANLGAPDIFYVGDGKGGFREATAEFGFELEKGLCSYAVVFSDVNGDRRPDVMVANDLQPANLFINHVQDGVVQFKDEAVQRGFAFNLEGRATSAMGLAVADIDLDGDDDVFRTNFDFEPNSLHVNNGRGSFTDDALGLGLTETSMDKLGWGTAFIDCDLDGDLDLVIANGHVYPQAEEIGMSPWLQRSQLYEAVVEPERGLVYRDVEAGPGLAALRSARGLAVADADDDGDLDLAIIDLDGPPRLLENRSARRGSWVSVRLVGTASNRDGYGARVEVTAGGVTRVREMRTTDGLYSSHDPRLHFGLGDVEKIERIRVLWPSGRRSLLHQVEIDRQVVMIEPELENR